ncbi:MAG: hypothetical protein Q4A58_00820 [Fusobacterium sp.]|uniref:hypothetical protein n=1 Tax=Fusobacterium sp. TaxID=68766 RepID=UPI0026DC7EA2|nr:hypothetical protein [Fusobacterium sp.]MDO4689824.1 hypothetical protein [Fusobacterium sp.]
MGNVDYNSRIHNLKKRIAVLTKRKRYLQRKGKKKERILRARKLLKLGIIFEITLTKEYSTEVIVGHLLELNNKENEIEYFKYLGEKILSEISIEKHDQKEVLFLDREEKKKRNHKLISLGALFEMTERLDYPLAVQIGYIDSLHSSTDTEMKVKEEKGKKYIEKRRFLKNGRKYLENFL